MEESASAVDAQTIYTPSEIIRMIDGKANAVFSEFGALGFLAVSGVLGPVRENRYPTFYGVELRDPSGGDPLLLDIPKNLAPELLSGREVDAGGFLQAKKGLKYSLHVSRLTSRSAVSADVLKEERSIRDIFLRPSLGADSFQEADDLLVSYIHGKASLVFEDFEHQVMELDDIDLEPVPVSIQDPDAVRDAIQSARGNVVVLMRGGGNEGDFEVFNRPQVLEAWREKAAYKVSALGHSKNSTMLDRFSHKVCDTPTDAGRFIREQVEAQRSTRFLAQKAMQADKNLSEVLQRTNADWEKRLAASQQAAASTLHTLQKQAETSGVQELAAQAKCRQLETQLARKAPGLSAWVWGALLAALVLGAFAGAVLVVLAGWLLR